MHSETRSRLGVILAVIVISVAVVGYFTGLQAPMNPASLDWNSSPFQRAVTIDPESNDVQPGVIPATHYSQMVTLMQARAGQRRSSVADLKSSVDPWAEIQITEADKKFALEVRQLNRAFNGAPPTVPHPIDQMSSLSCMACHGEGFTTSTLRASRMSHQFLDNCTQCHVEQNPQHIPASEFRESTFVGLPAPFEGPRAYPGAPPSIPHTTWMRVDCLSCHGVTGAYGIRTTHPWQDSCLQCHAPSSELDQIKIDPTPAFLKPLVVEPSSTLDE